MVYPNPTNRIVTIRTSGNGCDAWEICDLFGKVCLQGGSQLDEFEIDLSALVAGTYFARILDESYVSTQIIVKE